MLVAPFVPQEVYDDLGQEEREQLARDRMAAILDGLRCGSQKCPCRHLDNTWTHCPAHEDKHPSLKLYIPKNNSARLEIFCITKKGGKRTVPCTRVAVLNALHARGLWHRSYVVAETEQP